MSKKAFLWRYDEVDEMEWTEMEMATVDTIREIREIHDEAYQQGNDSLGPKSSAGNSSYRSYGGSGIWENGGWFEF